MHRSVGVAARVLAVRDIRGIVFDCTICGQITEDFEDDELRKLGTICNSCAHRSAAILAKSTIDLDREIRYARARILKLEAAFAEACNLVYKAAPLAGLGVDAWEDNLGADIVRLKQIVAKAV